MVVFAVMVTAALSIVLSVLDVTADNAHRVAAANLATKQIEAARSELAIDIPDGATSRVEMVGGTTYTITQNANYTAGDAASSLCETSGGALANKLVTVTVTWPNMGTVRPVRVDTVKALGVGVEGLDEAFGTLAVGVSGANGDPISGVVLTLSPGGATRTTGIDGCAVFVGLAVDADGTDYTAAVNQAGYTGPANVQAVQGTAGVLAGNVAQLELTYDQTRTLTLQPAAPAGFSPPPGLPVGVRSSFVLGGQLLPACPAAGQACASGVPGTVQGVFPGVYDVWAGRCLYPRPAGAGASVDATAADAVIDVPLQGVQIWVSDAGAPLSGWTVRALAADGDGCQAGDVYDLTPTGSAGTTVALPAGRWTLRVTSPDGSQTQEQTVSVPPGPAVTVVDFEGNA